MGFRLANVAGRAALVLNDHYFDLSELSQGSLSADPMRVLTQPERLGVLSQSLASSTPSGSVANAELHPPVPRPRNVYAIGLNYLSHADESGMQLPKEPLVFTKFPSCLSGANSTIEMRSDFCDYEGELVVVIGRGGKDIPADHAWDHVLGLTVGQDISDRVAQFAAQPPHFDLGKSFDTFGPTGPVVTALDALTNRDDLRIVTTVNGDVRQNASTAEMIFDVPTLISYISRITTLSVGDIIFTGTPDGIGATKGMFLKDGDVVATTIEGIGTMTNRCSRVSDYQGDDH